ncbi:MAG: hypothetical protein ACRDDF_11730, partial [Aeromonas sp.]
MWRGFWGMISVLDQLRKVFEDTHLYTYRCCEDSSNRLVAWFQQDTTGIITISELKMEGANKEL